MRNGQRTRYASLTQSISLALPAKRGQVTCCIEHKIQSPTRSRRLGPLRSTTVFHQAMSNTLSSRCCRQSRHLKRLYSSSTTETSQAQVRHAPIAIDLGGVQIGGAYKFRDLQTFTDRDVYYYRQPLIHANRVVRSP